MGFDVAVGATQDQLNAVGAALYKQLYPKLFTGSVPVPTLGLTVGYDVKQPPAIDLDPPPPQLMSDFEQPARQAAAAAAAEGGVPGEALLAGLMSSALLFSVHVPLVAVTLTASDGKKTELSLALDAVCQAAVDESSGHVRLTALHIAVPKWTDPTVQWVLENVVSPQAMKFLNQYLAGITVPPPTIAGVKLHVPIAVVDGGRLVALTTLQRGGPPVPPPKGALWPSGGFFTLVSTAAADAAAAVEVAKQNPHFRDSGHPSWANFTLHWSYDLTLGDPAIAISGGGFHLGMNLSGGVGAGLSADLGIFGHPSIRFGVGFSTKPNPGGTVDLSVDAGNAIVASVKHVDPFGIAVDVPGLPWWANEAVKWVTSTITSALTGSLVPAVNLFIGRLHFDVFTIGDISVDAGPVRVKVIPADLQVGSFGELISATGVLEVQPA